MNQIQKLTQAIRNCAECELDYGTLRTLKMIDDESIRMEKSVVVKPPLCDVLAEIDKKTVNIWKIGKMVYADDIKEILSKYFA